MNSDSQGSCKIQSEINSCFILSKLDDSNNAGEDAVTHTSTNSLFTILRLLLFNSVLPPTVIEATSIFQEKFIARSFLSRKDKEVKQQCYRLPPTRALCTGWQIGTETCTLGCRALHHLSKFMLFQHGHGQECIANHSCSVATTGEDATTQL